MYGGLGQILRQVASRSHDGRLNILRGRIDVALEVELHSRPGWLPSTLVEVSCETPGISENWYSSGAATVVAMVSGLAPGSEGAHRMVGKSTWGSGATGSKGKATSPYEQQAPP